MNVVWIRIVGVAALLVGMLAWVYGGAQIGFYKTYYGLQRTDEITGLSYEEQVEAFQPGIETLALGFFVFLILTLASGVMETRRASH